ncbi:hypothetical protein TeGR_g1705, partial [Tetraparma gracilis]
FEVKEVKPKEAACIIEADVNLDFEQPVGYVERDWKKEAEDAKKEKFSSMPKQSAHGGASPSISASPAGSVTGSAGGVPPMALGGGADAPKGPRIVNGQILGAGGAREPETEFLADKIGATGVQRNKAIPEKAPETQYWAIAGGGSRLDGKKPSPLKDKEGKEMDPREVRAAAAAARLATTNPPPMPDGPKRKSLIGNKFSKRMVGGATAFGGSGNTM